MLLSKEDVLQALDDGSVANAQQPATVQENTMNQVLAFLNNPVVMRILDRILDKFLPTKAGAVNDVANPSQSKLSGEKVYELVTGAISFLDDKMTIADLKKELTANKEQYIKVFDNYANKLIQ